MWSWGYLSVTQSQWEPEIGSSVGLSVLRVIDIVRDIISGEYGRGLNSRIIFLVSVYMSVCMCTCVHAHTHTYTHYTLKK